MLQKRGTPVFTNRRYLDAVEDHIVIFDGAMGTQIQRFNLTAEDFGGEKYNGLGDYLVITRPDVIEEIHAAQQPPDAGGVRLRGSHD
jgi:methionine synthase I (cobalamin-dependent)